LRRHHALTGYIVLLIARKVVRRKLAQTPSRARGATEATSRGLVGRALSNTTQAGGAMGSWFMTNGGRAGVGMSVLAPYALAAARDPEVQLSLGRAATAGRDAFDRVSVLTPRDALHAVAYDSKVQSRLGEAARELDAAIDSIGFKARPRKSPVKKILMLIGLATVVCGVVVGLKHFLGGGEDEFIPEVDAAPAEAEGADTTAA
jgi:hypothetical protein